MEQTEVNEEEDRQLYGSDPSEGGTKLLFATGGVKAHSVAFGEMITHCVLMNLHGSL